MATVTRFEDLEIWKRARALSKDIFILSKDKAFNEDLKLKQQMLSSSGSIMDNIAEGFDREGTKEFGQFLSIARGSLAELKSQLYRCSDREYFEAKIFERLITECTELSKMIKAFMNYLKSTEHTGLKYKSVHK